MNLVEDSTLSTKKRVWIFLCTSRDELWQSLTENDFAQLPEVNTLRQREKRRKVIQSCRRFCVHS